MRQLPEILNDAIIQGVWKNPGADVLRNLFGSDLPDMELFEDATIMENVKRQLERARYVDDPEFCFAREFTLSHNHSDPRLVFERALFLGGSIIPGDDVFIAADLINNEPQIFLFDWEQSIPNRWIPKGTLGNLIEELRVCMKKI